jgi:hypothetical protein
MDSNATLSSGLAWATDETSLRHAFEPYGEVQETVSTHHTPNLAHFVPLTHTSLVERGPGA